jgi:hypothetical protein
VYNNLAATKMNSALVWARSNEQRFSVNGIPIDTTSLDVPKQVALVQDGWRLSEKLGAHPAASFVGSMGRCGKKLLRRAKTAEPYHQHRNARPHLTPWKSQFPVRDWGNSI